MNHLSSPRLRRYFSFLACAGLLCAASVHAKRVALTDIEMSDVNAQGLFILENSSYGGLDFSKIALDADVTLNANFGDILLGKNSLGISDIDIPALQFGRRNGTDGTNGTKDNRLVQISNPYIQFVYDKSNGPTKVIGVRLGFDGISGDLGLLATAISGSMYVDGKNTLGGVLDATGKGWTGSNASCPAPCTTQYLNLSQIGGITAGNAEGPSRDFWISALKSNVSFPAPPGMEAPKEAMAGYWLNFRDRLVALSATLPPNKPPGH